MRNPFLKCLDDENNTIYIDPNCSINKVVLAKLPLYGVEDELEGMRADQIFSAQIMNDYITDKAVELNIDINNDKYRDKVQGKELPKYISQCLADKSSAHFEQAKEVAALFGHRLGLILLTLKTGLKQNRRARDDWDDAKWEYLAQLDKVILVGGLTNDKLGLFLKKYALEVFDKAGIEPYEILLFNNASHLGIMGCTTLIKETDSVNIVFDFGQTNLKRSIVIKENNKVLHERPMPSLESRYMQKQFESDMELREYAGKLNEYIINVITDTYNEVSKDYSLGGEIIISIANYVVSGRIYSLRGGYAKLSVIGENYADILSKELSRRLNKNITVSLVHDGTAIALHFKEYCNSICISVGTAFGVGYPF